MKILASELKEGMIYKAKNGTIQRVKKIERVSSKTITFRTERIAPNPYDGNFYQRPSLNTKFEIIEP